MIMQGRLRLAFSLKGNSRRMALKKGELAASRRRLLPDIVHAEVGEDARLDVAGVQDVHVASRAGQAAGHGGAVVPEVGHEDRLLLAHRRDASAAAMPLLGRRHELEHRLLARRA